MTLGAGEAARIEAAIAATRGKTSSQIVCVLARASSSYETMPLIWSILLALAAPWPLLMLTEWSAERIFLAQLGVFLLALVVLTLTPLGIGLTPRSAQRANAHRAALGQFMIRGLSHGGGRANVLIYVSLAEHYGRIVADDGAAAKVSQSQWQTVVNEMLVSIKRGDLAEALSASASSCADLLAPDFPPGGEPAATPHQHFHMV